MAIRKDLGIATAYGYAVSKGYTGTEEEFAELMASYASVGQTATQAAENASASATASAGSAAQSAQSATNASNSATAASTSATNAAGSATDAGTEALKAEGVTLGKQNGVEVGSDSPYYHANSKYYSEQAQATYDQAVAVKNSIPQDYTALSTDVDDIKADLNDLNTSDALKINKPETNPDGTNGQLLRTLGNGKTEWTNFAAPTDEQVQASIDAWLNKHPEATTTVEDWSLTQNKFVKGALGWVTPQMFGAKGDGETDDSEAIKLAADYAITNGFAVFFPTGTYIVRSSYLAFKAATGQSIVWVGNGRRSIIKRKDNSLRFSESSTGWNVLLNFGPKEYNTQETCAPKVICIQHMSFDSNRRGQSELADPPGNYETSPVLYFTSNGANYGVNLFETILLDDLYFCDPVADFIAFGGYYNPAKMTILRNILCEGRNGYIRNDIDFVGLPYGDIYMSNIKCENIHAEYLRSVPENGTPGNCFINNVHCRDFTFGGQTNIYATNLIVDSYFNVGGGNHSAYTNCTFNLDGQSNSFGSNNAEYQQTCIFTSCKFVLKNSYGTLYLKGWRNVTFADCQFANALALDVDTDNDGINDHVLGVSPLRFGMALNVTYTPRCIIANCDFDPAFYNIYSMDGGCGNIILKDMIINTYYGPSIGDVQSGAPFVLKYDNIEFGPMCVLWTQSAGNVLNENTRIVGDIVCNERNGMTYLLQNSHPLSAYAGLRRTILMSVPLTKDNLRMYLGTPTIENNIVDLVTVPNYISVFKGDTIVYRGENAKNYPSRWVVPDTALGMPATGSHQITDTGRKDGVYIFRPEGVCTKVSSETWFVCEGYICKDSNTNNLTVWLGDAWHTIGIS